MPDNPCLARRGGAAGRRRVGGCLQTGSSAPPSARPRAGASGRPPARPPRGGASPPRGAAAAPRRARTPSPEVRQRRMDLLGALLPRAWRSISGYVIYLGWNGGTVGNGAEAGLAYAVGAGAVVVPRRPRRSAASRLILRPSAALAAVGRRRRAFAIACRPAAGAGRADRRPRARGRPQGPLRARLLPAITAAGLGEVLYWATTTLFQRIGAHIIAVVLVVSGAAADRRPLGLGHDRGGPPRLLARQARRRRSSRPRSRRPGADRPRPVDTDPADTEPALRAARGRPRRPHDPARRRAARLPCGPDHRRGGVRGRTSTRRCRSADEPDDAVVQRDRATRSRAGSRRDRRGGAEPAEDEVPPRRPSSRSRSASTTDFDEIKARARSKASR